MTTATLADNQRLLNRTGATVAIMLVLTLAGGIAALAKIDVPASNHDILLVLITAVASNVGNIINYFFGSSAGAKAKDDTINTLTTTAAATLQAATKPDLTLQPGGKVEVAAAPSSTENQS